MDKTGTMHAWEHEGIPGPDIQTIGKALGGGFVPLSSVLCLKKIFDALSMGSGRLAHGHTLQVFSPKNSMIISIVNYAPRPTPCLRRAITAQKIMQ